MAGLNETPKGDRVHIAFFGLRNAGKSTLVNRLTGQDVAIVSDVAGTTTDPVSKAMEILPLGPCLVTDTAGLDDEGPLGEMRVKKSLEVLATTDIAVWVEECAATSAAPPASPPSAGMMVGAFLICLKSATRIALSAILTGDLIQESPWASNAFCILETSASASINRPCGGTGTRGQSGIRDSVRHIFERNPSAPKLR